MEPIIKLEAVSFRYHNRENLSLAGIDFSLKQRDCVALSGPSGSGKSTLCQCLNGLIPQALEGDLQGRISVNHKDPRSFRVQTMAQEIGLVMQDPEVQIVGRTVYEDVAFGPRNYLLPKAEIEQRVYEALKQVGLENFEGRSTSALSGGEKQRLAIAGVLAMQPKILVLDEPASELDPAGRGELYKLLATLRKTNSLSLIIVEQKLNEIAFFVDTVILMDQGQIVWRGLPEDLPDNSWKGGSLNSQTTVSKQPGNRFHTDSMRANHDVALQVSDLSFHYENSRPTLKNINLTLYQDDFIALVGRNGAGKTSLAKHLNGLIAPSVNTVFYYGTDITTMKTRQLSQAVGYVFQNPDHQIFESTVEREIAYGLKSCGVPVKERKRRVQEILDYMDLNPFRKYHPYTLSKGLRQIIAVASIVALQPKLLIIDEPTTGLDNSGVVKIMEIINRLHAGGTAIVLISHDMDLVAQYTNRVVVLNQGKIIGDGPTEDIFRKKDLLKQAGLLATGLTRGI